MAGCTASADEVRPPEDVLSFPSGLAISPDESVLFVANANSELRYDSGSISVIDVGVVRAAIFGWDGGLGQAQAGCEVEAGHPETLVCDEADFMVTSAGVRIGNFATDIALQDFGDGKYRVFVPTRGDPSIAWADFVDGKLDCNVGSERFELCDDAHRLSQLENDPDLDAIPEEPFGVFADGPSGVAMVTHLSTGAVSLIAAPPPGGDGPANVRVVDVRSGFFNLDANNTVGATSIVGRPSGPGATDPRDLIYVGSRTDRRVQTFTVGTLPLPDPDVAPVATEPAYLLPSNYFLLTEVGNVVGSSTDTRGMQFSPDGTLYLVNRQPPSLQLYDTTLGPTGFPKNVGIGGTDICRQASTVAVFNNGDGERAYVSCFQDGQLYVIDRRELDQPEDILLVGRGPYSVVGAGSVGNQQLLFVSNFLEDTIAVVDVTPGSATYNRVVLRMGKPRVP
ncbi:MAG: hypothetical protein H7138_11285 [Myxococcales bacterium]|nr:hypothetical protein [Myxococcales bacterium]